MHEFVEIDSLVERGALLALLLAAPPLAWRTETERSAAAAEPLAARLPEPA